jgi:hypothetical protein
VPNAAKDPVSDEGEAAPLLSSVGLEVARDLSLLPSLNDYLRLRARTARSEPVTLEEVILRQQIIETVLMAFLEVQGVIAQIDDEVDHTQELQDRLENKRDASVRTNNIANFVASGALQMIGSGIQIGTPGAWQNAGNEIEVITGGASIGLSSYQLKLGQGSKRSAAARPNMLAKVLDRSTSADTQYPEGVWNYLCNAPPGLRESRRQLLIDRWVANKRIPSPKTRGGQKEIDLLTASVPQNHAITIDLLSNRSAMLADLRATLSQFTKSLVDILQIIRKR